MNKCKFCNRIWIWERKKGGTRDKCNSCHTNERRFKLKEKILDFFGGKCVKCGYNKSKRALHVHHLDPKIKDFNISGSHSRSWNVIKVELEKCVMLCANCHAEEHDLQLNAPVTQ